MDNLNKKIYKVAFLLCCVFFSGERNISFASGEVPEVEETDLNMQLSKLSSQLDTDVYELGYLVKSFSSILKEASSESLSGSLRGSIGDLSARFASKLLRQLNGGVISHDVVAEYFQSIVSSMKVIEISLAPALVEEFLNSSLEALKRIETFEIRSKISWLSTIIDIAKDSDRIEFVRVTVRSTIELIKGQIVASVVYTELARKEMMNYLSQIERKAGLSE